MIAIFPKIVQASEERDVERLAVLARRYFGGDKIYAPTPDVRDLLIQVGVEVETLPLDNHGALIAKDERGTFQIVAIATEKSDQAANRFLLAHMLGHVLLDIMPLIAKGDWQVSGYRETGCPMQRYAQGGVVQRLSIDEKREELADQFAAALLMPMGMVKRAEGKFQDLEKTARFFGVPKLVLERRLQDIGVLPPRTIDFLDAESKLRAEGEPTSGAENDRPKGIQMKEASMPRSYAASTYTQTARSTKSMSGEKNATPAPRRQLAPAQDGAKGTRTANVEPKPAPKERPATLPRGQVNSQSDQEPKVKGMDRIRELAKRLDQAHESKVRKGTDSSPRRRSASESKTKDS